MAAKRFPTTLAVLAVALLTLGACEGPAVEGEYPGPRQKGQTEPTYGQPSQQRESVFGEGGLTLFGEDKPAAPEAGGGIGVNGFLWRAALDTVSFLPVTSADPFGGVIITHWHSPAEANGERFKINVYILGRSLRADGVRVALFRQVRDRVGVWADANVADAANARIEDAILTRARQLRFAALQQ